MVSARHGEAVPMRQNNRCQRCECQDGQFQCQDLSEDERCPRADPSRTPASCMMDGEEVEHGERRPVSGELCFALMFSMTSLIPPSLPPPLNRMGNVTCVSAVMGGCCAPGQWSAEVKTMITAMMATATVTETPAGSVMNA